MNDGKCVYVIRALTTDYYKIGITVNIDNRIKGLLGGAPFWDLELIVAHYCERHRDLERCLHEKYADKRLKKGEWFEFTSDEITELAVDKHDLLDSFGIIEIAEEIPLPELSGAEQKRWSKHSTTLHDMFPSQTDDRKQIVDDDVEADENSSGHAKNESISTLDQIQDHLVYLRFTKRLGWREIADLPEYRGVPPGTLCSIMKGRNPKKHETRHILGLPTLCPRCGMEIER